MTTTIEWTHVPDGAGGRKKGETWNPQVGCSEISPGCRNCYAAKLAHRGMSPQHRGLTVLRSNGPHWNGVVRPVPHLLEQPLRWRAPRGIFVGSMTDIFHESRVGTEEGRRYIAAIFAVMAACPQHTFMLLTKRPDQMREWFAWLSDLSNVTTSGPGTSEGWALANFGTEAGLPTRWTKHPPSAWTWPLPNVWLMTTTEDQRRADERIPDLLACPAVVHGLSVEPILGPVDLNSSIGGTRWIGGQRGCVGQHRGIGTKDCPRKSHHHHDDTCSKGIDWVITGGESGPGARPPHPDWFRALRDQCTEAGVPFLFKQWGAWGDYEPSDPSWTHMVSSRRGKTYQRDPSWTYDDGSTMAFMRRVGKKNAGRDLDGRTWDQFPEEAT